jgi:hypothetical protein
MWKIVAVLMLTVAVILLARLVYNAPMVQMRVGLGGIERMADTDASRIPPLMYGGVRG